MTDSAANRNPSNASIPTELDDAIFAALGRPESEHAAAFAELAGRWPDHREHLRERLQASASDAAAVTYGRFEILGTLGEGGMGRVHLAYDPAVGREVALKEMWPHLLHDASSRARFDRERKALAMLQHPHLCRILETGARDGVPFLVIELVRGRSLDRILDDARHGRRPWAELGAAPREATDARPSSREEVRAVLILVEKVARAVHAVHEAGLVHRDLKPGNIMVQPDGEPVVLDFGLAFDEARAVGLTLSGHQPGTPAYKSPEQVRGEPVDRRTDVWSLGVVLYECLALARPFTGLDVHDLERSVREDAPKAPHRHNRAVPRDVSTVVEKALEKDAARRYTTAADFADELQRVLDGRPVQARRAGPLLRTRRWAARQRLAASLLLVAFAALAVAVGFAVVAESRAAESQTNAARSSFRAGMLALQVGDWPKAIASLEEARALGHPDQVELAFGLVEAFEASERAEDALAELERNRAEFLRQPRHAARFRLLRADLGANRLRDPDDGLDDVRQALQARDADGAPALSVADRSYAAALLAADLPATREHLERALVDQPRHRLALEQLGMTLLLLADWDAAEGTAETMRRLYPQDVFPWVVTAVARGMRDGPGALETVLVELAARHPAHVERITDGLRALVRVRNDLGSLIRQIGETDNARFIATLQSIVRVAGTVPELVDGLTAGPGALVRVPPPFGRLTRSFARFAADLAADAGGIGWAVRLLSSDSDQRLRQVGPALLAALDEGWAMMPDGVFALLRAHLHCTAWRLDRVAAARDFRRAYESRSVFDLRRSAMWQAQIAEVHLAAVEKQIEPELKAEFRRLAESTVELYIREVPLGVNGYAWFVNTWLTLDRPVRAYALAGRFRDDHPDDLRPLLFQASAAVALHAPQLVLRHAREALERDPDNADAQALAERGRALLREVGDGK